MEKSKAAINFNNIFVRPIDQSNAQVIRGIRFGYQYRAATYACA